MTALEVLWWLVFLGAVGACVGSFLNVVIYRVPRDLSLAQPLWSFCPHCAACIRWYDNLPVLSYVLLGGRCRHCRMPIAPRYPLVELLGALLVLLVFDAFFIAHTHAGLGRSLPGVTWQLSEDWPIFLAHVVLFAALLAMSAIDLEHYWVDVRFTTFATVAGFALHALWTPTRFGESWQRPSDPLAAGALAATAAWVASLAVLWGMDRGRRDLTGNFSGDCETPYDALAEQRLIPRPAPCLPEGKGSAASPAGSQGSGSLAVAVAAVGAVVLAYGAWAQATAIGPPVTAGARWLPGIAVLLLIILAGAAPRRAADHEIIEEIEAERSTARRTALLELLLLLPAVILGLAAYRLCVWGGPLGEAASQLLGWTPWSDWAPLRGLGTAAAGFVIGGAIGWLVRLSATLVIGREAFGTGDIHMMAAAGCVAGWPVVLIGFVLCSLLALAGWIVVLPFKRSGAIPLGPWLSISFLLVVLFYDSILASPFVRNVVELYELLVSSGKLTGAP